MSNQWILVLKTEDAQPFFVRFESVKEIVIQSNGDWAIWVDDEWKSIDKELHEFPFGMTM